MKSIANEDYFICNYLKSGYEVLIYSISYICYSDTKGSFLNKISYVVIPIAHESIF